MAFIAGLGEKHMAQAMFGEDFFERQTGNAIEYYADPEVRAVKVIGELLRATRAKEPGDVVGSRRTLEQAVSAGNALWQLAKRLPESSYAPYAAYFAGCSFTVRVMHENKEAHGRLISPAGRNSEYYEEGQEAFTLATTRGDDYLKPRALYYAAFLRICGGEFDKGEELLAKAERAAPGEGTIRTMVSTLRRDIARTRSKLEQADGEPDDDD